MSEDVSQHIKAILDFVRHLEEDIVAKQSQLQNLSTMLDGKKHEVEQEEAALSDRHKAITEECKTIDTDIAAYKGELAKLKTEVSTLIARKADLKIANSKLEQENKSFKEYEDKAWKALKAKDDDLLARERNVRQKEAINPSAKTFLPEA